MTPVIHDPRPPGGDAGRTRLNSAVIRRLNTARIFHALREHPASSQRALAGLTGLDAATVSSIVARLEAEGLLQRSAAQRSGLAGRPECLLGIALDAGLLIGAGLAPDAINLVATGLDGRRRGQLDLPGSTDPASVLATLRLGVQALLEQTHTAPARLRGIGIGVPGLLDARGHLVMALNLGWRDLPLAGMLRDGFTVPVQIDNDAKAAARGERIFGAVRGVADFLFVYGNAGIGGGLYLGGRLYRGCGGLAGELGHMKIVPDGRPCGCGGRGCLEAYVSERAIRSLLREQGRDLAGAAAVAIAAGSGDAVVLGVLAEAGARLGLALANLVNIVNPRAVVLGGDLAMLAPWLVPAASRALAHNALPVMLEDAAILVSALGAEAVAMGGVALAMEGYQPLPQDFAAARA